MTTIGFFVSGVPAAQGSMRSPKAGVVLHSSGKLKVWRELVGWKANEAIAGRPLMEGPLALEAQFDFARPKRGHGGELWKATTPDLDKLLRALGDAMEGVVYRNDAQIAEIT